MPMLSVQQIWVPSLVQCWAQIFLLTGYWVGWSSRTRQLIAISLSYFVLPVSCMSRVETNSSNLFPFSDAWIGSSPNRIIWLRMRQFEERLRIFWFLRDQVVCEWVVIGNLIVWQDVLKSYPGGSTECATEKEWSTRPSVELPVGEKSLGASSFCGALPPYTLPHTTLGEGGEHISNFEHFECRCTTLQKLGRCDPGLLDFWQHNLFRHYYFSLCIGSQKQKYHQRWRQFLRQKVMPKKCILCNIGYFAKKKCVKTYKHYLN